MNRDLFVTSLMTVAGLFGLLVGYRVGTAVMLLVGGFVGVLLVSVRDD